MSKSPTVLVAIVFVLLPTTGFSEDATSHKSPAARAISEEVKERMKQADADGDGRVTREEIRKWDKVLDSRFRMSDRDEDGALNLQEFETLITYRRTTPDPSGAGIETRR